jgi:hypothetical protein
MRKKRTVLLIIGCAVAISLATATKAIVTERAQVESKQAVRLVMRISAQDPPAILSKVESVLLPETGVPLRWPSLIPSGADEEHPLFVNLLSADRTSYNIELGWTEDCIGGNYCHYATIRGSVKPLAENEGVRVPIKLSGGIRGYFIEFKCGAHCDDSSIGWVDGDYHYSISMKAEKKETLIKVVNSAIAAGHA